MNKKLCLTTVWLLVLGACGTTNASSERNLLLMIPSIITASGNKGEPDCNGVPGGSAVIDVCDVCGGDDSSCQQTPFFDITDRESVITFYDSVYQKSETVEFTWSGEIATCNQGETTEQYKSAILSTINWARAMAGVPNTLSFTPEYNSIAQAGSLVIAANQQLSHYPQPSWKCWSHDAYNGTSTSNLGVMEIFPTGEEEDFPTPFEIGMSNLREWGDNNEIVGHRRNLLQPQMRIGGIGTALAPYSGQNYNSLYYAQKLETGLSNRPRPDIRDSFIAWPPPGFVPYQVVYPRWHIEMVGADLSQATVSMTVNGKAVKLTTNEPFSDSFSSDAEVLVWNPTPEEPFYSQPPGRPFVDFGVWPKPVKDLKYQVTIHNVFVNGVNKDINYDVTVIAPTSSGKGLAPMY